LPRRALISPGRTSDCHHVHRGFRAAAAETGMSRPALSHAIAALEAKLGVRLFHRTTRSVSLTETGEQFVSGVAPALGQIREAMERA
jgi:DNA-binding transcriptional LysR family regulator